MAEENKAMELHGEESEKKKYISDVLDIDKLIEEYGNKIMLIAGVGSGKSTWVKDVLTQKGNVLFITSRRAKVDEDIAHSCFTSFVREQDGQRENLITNAKLGYILINAHADMQMTVDNFLNCYEYIVVDEIHSMASDSTFARSSFDVLTFIEYAAEQGHKVIVMTGTPEPVQSYFQNNGWHIEDYRKICNYVKPEAIKYIYKEKRADVIKEALEENKKVIYFVNNTVTITETIREVLDKRIGEIEKIAVIVSDEKRKDMDAALKEKFPGYNEEINDQVYTSLIQNQVLPEECEILISTSRLKEGVDILNENACVICDNHILSNLIQFFGRVRVGGGTVYIIEDAQQHEIKHDKLLYEYAKQQEITAANKFVDTYIKEQEDVFEYGPTFSLIRFVEQNPYIRYNFIKKKFQLFEIKYNEEIRLLNIKDWKEELQDYCEEYGIKTPLLIPRYKMQGIIEEGFTKNLEPDKRFYGEDIERIKGIIRRNYGIKYTQIKKINESLEEQGVSFRIYSGKETSKEHGLPKNWWVSDQGTIVRVMGSKKAGYRVALYYGQGGPRLQVRIKKDAYPREAIVGLVFADKLPYIDEKAAECIEKKGLKAFRKNRDRMGVEVHHCSSYVPFNTRAEAMRNLKVNCNPKNMRFLLSKMHDMLDYLQPNMRRLYAGTETPEDILALSEAADRAGIGNEVYVIMPGRSVRQGDIVTGEAITRDANRLAYEWMRPGIIVANRIH